MIDKNTTHKIIKSYFCDFRSKHVNKNYSNFFAFENSMLTRVFRNIKRFRDDEIFKKRKSIIKNILLKIFDKLNVSTRQKITLYVFFCLIFAIFFRINEFIYFNENRNVNDFAL